MGATGVVRAEATRERIDGAEHQWRVISHRRSSRSDDQSRFRCSSCAPRREKVAARSAACVVMNIVTDSDSIIRIIITDGHP